MTITNLGTLDAAGTSLAFTAGTLGVAASAVTLQCVAVGDPLSIILNIEGSVDGLSWGVIGTHTFSAPELAAKVATFSVVDKPTQFVRITITTLTYTTSCAVTTKGLV